MKQTQLFTIIPHKTRRLLDVLVLRLTEQHYFETLGWKKTIEADCSWEMAS